MPGALKICCDEIPEFGTYTLRIGFGCDVLVKRCSVSGFSCENAGLPCATDKVCSGTGAPCVTLGEDCPDDGTCTDDGVTPCDPVGAVCGDSGVCVGTDGGVCTESAPGDCIEVVAPGSTGFFFDRTFDFTNNGVGNVSAAFAVHVQACVDVIEGSGNRAPVAGDVIEARFRVEVTTPEDITFLDMASSTMVQGDAWTWDGSAPAVGGGLLNCSVGGSLPFGAAGHGAQWASNSCPASVRFYGYVRVVDSMGLPTNVAIKSTGAGLSVDGSVTGECCGPHSIIEEEITT